MFGLLVDVEADAVAEPVAVVLSHPGRPDRDARRRVDVLADGARPDGGERVQLRREAEVVELAQAALGSPVKNVRVQSER